jgi:hypothetical protein
MTRLKNMDKQQDPTGGKSHVLGNIRTCCKVLFTALGTNYPKKTQKHRT